jgi:branched-chain amino acid transport system ATP-binding protein
VKVLEIQGLKAYYDKALILRGIDLEVGKGETVAVLGPNGAGKTTLMKSVMGTVKTEGKIFFNGENISKLPTHQRVSRGITLCPEGRQLFPDMTVEDNLMLGAKGDNVDDRLEMVYNLFPELKRKRNSLAKFSSGGEQQMTAIGRALMANPKILLLDEPSFGLAPIVISRIRDVIKRIRSELPILIVEQNVKLANDVSDRICIMANGEIIEKADAPHMNIDRLYFV